MNEKRGRHYDFVVLGGTGMQGRIAARDLLNNGHSVLICGRDHERVRGLLKHKKSGFAMVDMENIPGITRIIKNAEAQVVVNCAELAYNIHAMKACLKAKTHYLDLGGLHAITLKQFMLHHNFKRANLIAVTGCGSAPGITNVMASYAVQLFDTVQDMNAGFAWDSNIKKFYPPYSIQSIVEEFSQKPVVLHNGKLEEQPKFSCFNEYDRHLIGKQKAWCIVHSEVYTFWRYFKGMGLRNVHFMSGFPDHSLNTLFMLMDLGFTSVKPITMQGKKIIPLEFITKIMKRLKMSPNYREKETLWIEVIGRKNGAVKKVGMECYIETLKGWEFAGCNVDTGMSISIMSQMVKNGLVIEKGVTAPEASIPPYPFFKELKKRGFTLYLNGRLLM